MKIPLTVLIPCKNEAQHIAAAIESARPIADEILVADSGSTDDTLSIVAQVGGCRIICRDQYIDSANFKNWAIPQAAHPWVLVLDADERITAEGRDEIEALLASEPDKQAYRVGFRVFFLGREMRHCGWDEASSLRLFHRDCRYSTLRAHAHLTVAPENTGNLQHKFLHYSYRSMSHYLAKQRRYSRNVARDWYEAGRTANFNDLWLKPAYQFWYRFFRHQGYLDGLAGFVLCLTSCYYTFWRYVELRNLCKVPPQLSRAT